LTCNLFSTSV